MQRAYAGQWIIADRHIRALRAVRHANPQISISECVAAKQCATDHYNSPAADLELLEAQYSRSWAVQS